MRRAIIDQNAVVTNTATSDDVGPSGTAVEVDGPATIADARISDNPVHAYSATGSAGATAGLAVYDFAGDPRQVTLQRVVISGNTASAYSPNGLATAIGAGVTNNSLLDVSHSIVRDNRGIARGRTATAQGRGIWNGVFLSGSRSNSSSATPRSRRIL